MGSTSGKESAVRRGGGGAACLDLLAKAAGKSNILEELHRTD